MQLSTVRFPKSPCAIRSHFVLLSVQLLVSYANFKQMTLSNHSLLRPHRPCVGGAKDSALTRGHRIQTPPSLQIIPIRIESSAPRYSPIPGTSSRRATSSPRGIWPSVLNVSSYASNLFSLPELLTHAWVADSIDKICNMNVDLTV